MSKTPDKTVISLLNEMLTRELTSINQYFCHARMCANWGYDRLAEKNRAESIDEMRHAQVLIDRILYLGGVPNLQRLGKVTIGETVKEQLTLDLAIELEAIPWLNAAIAQLTTIGDHGSRLLLEEILKSEEEHADWLEAQLELIAQLGESAYLTQQIRP